MSNQLKPSLQKDDWMDSDALRIGVGLFNYAFIAAVAIVCILGMLGKLPPLSN